MKNKNKASKATQSAVKTQKQSDRDPQNLDLNLGTELPARGASRPNFSDDVKSRFGEENYSSQQNKDDQSDWNMQSGSRNFSTRGKNQDYDYDEDDQEDENQFIIQGLIAAENSGDELLEQYGSPELTEQFKERLPQKTKLSKVHSEDPKK